MAYAEFNGGDVSYLPWSLSGEAEKLSYSRGGHVGRGE